MRPALSIAAAATVALVLAGAAYPIGIALSPTSASTSTTLNGVDQQATFAIKMTITGANQNGWRITAWAALPASGSRTLPALQVPTQPTQSPCTGGGCTNAVPTGISWPATLGTTSGAATKIYNAAAATGDGNIVISVPFSVTVPANTYSGTYTTTVALTISNTGP